MFLSFLISASQWGRLFSTKRLPGLRKGGEPPSASLPLSPPPTVDHGRKGGIKNVYKHCFAQGVDGFFKIVTPKLIADEFPDLFGAVIETGLQKFTQRRRQGELLVEFT